MAPASVPHPVASAPSAPVPFPVASAATAAPGRSAAELEQEAAVRLSKSLAHDFDDTSRDVQRRDIQAAGAGREDLGALLGRNAAAAVPPSATADTSLQNDRIKQLLGQAPATRDEGAWLKEYAKEADGKRTIRGYAAAGGYVLRQGKIIPAILGRQVNSDLPGRLTAYVSSNVYDSNNNLLIPKGSTLVGAYDSQVAVGQTRLMFAFTRLILPNGYSFDLPAAQGVDMAGASGMSGDVNNHFLKMFGTSLLIAVLADKGKQPSSVTQVGATGPATAAGQVLSDVSKTILERNRVIPPTITVDQGTRINVEVVADMVFPEPYPVRHP
nr:TrbI/VirB10 family protein [Ramlibacter albus]